MCSETNRVNEEKTQKNENKLNWEREREIGMEKRLKEWETKTHSAKVFGKVARLDEMLFSFQSINASTECVTTVIKGFQWNNNFPPTKNSRRPYSRHDKVHDNIIRVSFNWSQCNWSCQLRAANSMEMTNRKTCLIVFDGNQKCIQTEYVTRFASSHIYEPRTSC